MEREVEEQQEMKIGNDVKRLAGGMLQFTEKIYCTSELEPIGDIAFYKKLVWADSSAF